MPKPKSNPQQAKKAATSASNHQQQQQHQQHQRHHPRPPSAPQGNRAATSRQQSPTPSPPVSRSHHQDRQDDDDEENAFSSRQQHHQQHQHQHHKKKRDTLSPSPRMIESPRRSGGGIDDLLATPKVPPSLAEQLRSTSAWELAAALFARLVTRKRFWFVVIVMALWTAQRHEQELRDVIIPAVPAGMTVEEQSRPGLSFDLSKSKVQRPIVIVPGFITTGLELWEGKPCMLSDFTTNFRQRLFGPAMLYVLLRDPECFLEHLSLNPHTADDPDGIRVRHDTGFDAVDYFVPGFYVWAKLFVSLRDIFYEPSKLLVAAYDWRYDPELVQERASYFTRLKNSIELLYENSETTTRPVFEEDPQENGDGSSSDDTTSTNGKRRKRRISFMKQPKQKVVIISHSYGATMVLEFLQWADRKQPGWTDRYCHTHISIGGTYLGIPKAIGALISGEVKDTATLPSVSRRILDRHIKRRTRANVFRSWPCLSAMMTRGPERAFSSGVVQWTGNGTNLSMTETVRLVERIAVASNNTRLARKINETWGVRTTPRAMPRAPSMNVICVYGVGINTEVGYYLKDPERDFPSSSSLSSVKTGNNDGQKNGAVDFENDEGQIDWESIEFDTDNTETQGVRFGDGDGTVPLASLGYVCRSKKHFKKQVRSVKTVELEHMPELMDPRGGSASGDHVDVMGSYQMISTVLKAVSGLEDEIEDAIISDIDNITEEIDREE